MTKLISSFVVLLLSAACSSEFSNRPVEDVPCGLDPAEHHVPACGASSYLLEASPGTMLVDCAEDAEAPVATDQMPGDLEWVGPRKGASSSFVLPAGGCYQLVVCVSPAKLPAVVPMD